LREELVKRLLELKDRRRAVILAHNYQLKEVQDVADYVGDSLALAQKAASTQAEVIVLCGVYFMAETAAILNPDKTVLLPERSAGCPLADTIDLDGLKEAKSRHPGVPVVCYVNSSAAVKAESDICCTSSNAERIVRSLPDEKVLFVPDYNLGHYISQKTDKELILWPGSCTTHCRVTPDDVHAARKAHPEALVLVHPECPPPVVELADFVGSTSQILNFARETSAKTLIIGTEMGILYRLKQENPSKQFYLLSPGLICPNMKYTRLESIVSSLETMSFQVKVAEDIRLKAKEALERMLALS